MYAAIVTDLDGTLLDEQHAINDFTRQMLTAAVARGIRLVIATGRHYRDVQRLTAGITLPISLISSNGARVHDSDGVLLYADNLMAAQVRVLVQPALTRDVLVSLYLDDHGLMQRDAGFAGLVSESEFGEVVHNLADYHGEGVAKVLYCGAPERLSQIEAAIRLYFGDTLALTYSQPNYLEAMAAGVNKGAALAHLLPKLGLCAADCAAFGDGLNDVEMLQSVGHPFVMSNANPALLALLPHLPRAAANHLGGVAQQIRLALAL